MEFEISVLEGAAMIALDVTLTTREGARLISPVGLSTPDVTPMSLQVIGGRHEVLFETGSGQALVEVMPDSEDVTFRWAFQRGGATYPNAMFAQRDSKYTRAAADLVGEVEALVGGAASKDDALRLIVDHVAGMFEYGHRNDDLYEGHDDMPQLCGLTRGSCVDINAFLIAYCRAAGIEAGYVTGYFIPEEKRTSTTDMHCWVVTRTAAGVQEWDIAHHMKMGAAQILPSLNPKPGVRVAMSHSMGWHVPALGVRDLKLLAEPMWLLPDGTWERAKLNIAFAGYDALR
ncbi:MAG: transglutaminase domain-containing protein [Shimia sp.]|uniref:transglutaminase-like domain-containing protein n=1 Tax=Shimia sp. TaxID=1954381 RepID=UPI001B0DB886|nr:transglutaminase domain-containing protein [Shimia sp.]MBO6897810.1 transglutaminase domain-containing protein [Shimia sp.]